MDDITQGDICRVCRYEEQLERPLFHPCICTGSIKWIHQDCLMQWMRFSRKEYCELCGHRFSFTPIYSPDMPKVLPFRDVAGGLLSSIGTAGKYWLHYTLVAFAWLGIVPLTAYRTYRFMFTGSVDTFLSLPFIVISTENIATDILRGCLVVTCTLLSFVGLVWLREQILLGGGPDWLEQDDLPIINPPPPEVPVVFEDNMNDNNNNENNNGIVHIVPNIALDNVEPHLIGENGNAAVQDIANGNEEGNWNPMEWDRAAEELTWERLLGLDGSMVFVEHVFWVISLNTIFIFTFAFCPHSIGNFTLSAIDYIQPEKALLHFHGLLTTLFGYCVIGLALVFLHSVVKLLNMPRIRWFLGLCYVVVKVSLLSVGEIGVLPLICGWWLDICSLPMFDATIKDRKLSFRAAPGTSLFIHWMFGMVYVYYFASFIVLLREVLRPGVLWFLRNLNDPDFSPIQEMIHLSILDHMRRLIASAIIFGSAVLLMLWLPIQVLKYIWPSFLPYTLSADSEINELSLQLLLLQIVLPGFFEQSQTRIWLKGMLRYWCNTVSWMLGIRSYLLGSELANGNVNGGRPILDGQGLGAEHQVILQREIPIGYQPYVRPSFFVIRLFGLFILMCISIVIWSIITLTVPVWIGRKAMTLWSLGDGFSTQSSTSEEHPQRKHELYTAAIGIYICWIILKGISITLNLLPQGRVAIIRKIKHWIFVGASYALAVVIFILMLGVIPLLFGLLLELVLVIPLRVPFDETPIHFLLQDWALGVLYTKIACALALMGPDWSIKRAIEKAYRDGLRDIDLKFIIRELAMPVISCFGLVLAVPYVTAHSIIPLFFTNQQTKNLIAREIYPFLLLIAFFLLLIYFQLRHFKRLYVTIKNDKYLVGQRLVNYEHRKRSDNINQMISKTSNNYGARS